MKLLACDESGETVKGKLLDVRKGKSFTNHQYRVAEIRTKGGKRVALTLTRVLDAKLEKSGATIGDRVRIRYRGWRRSKKTGRKYRDFSVRVQ